MNKTKAIETTEKLTIGINELQNMLSLGRNTADEVGKKAGAVVRIGRRKLYNVKKIQAYLDAHSE